LLLHLGILILQLFVKLVVIIVPELFIQPQFFFLQVIFLILSSFMLIFSKLSDYKNEGVLEGWVRRIVVNTCLDQIRKNTKFLGDIQAEEVEYKLEQNSFIAEQLMADDLMRLVQQMPDGYRVVFNMFAIEGFSHQEIAEQLGVTESTSKSQYLRARAYLRDRIEKR
jgi:RNA polymerase sigma-70 factor (ECF subfamily)